ncbi:hypothetical protein MRX96_005113 [Rhipicephalus microplus]
MPSKQWFPDGSDDEDGFYAESVTSQRAWGSTSPSRKTAVRLSFTSVKSATPPMRRFVTHAQAPTRCHRHTSTKRTATAFSPEPRHITATHGGASPRR